jgi:hypothetical protein
MLSPVNVRQRRVSGTGPISARRGSHRTGAHKDEERFLWYILAPLAMAIEGGKK